MMLARDPDKEKKEQEKGGEMDKEIIFSSK